MAQGIARPDRNKAIETGGHLDAMAEEASRERRLVEAQYLQTLQQAMNAILDEEPFGGGRQGFEIR